MTQKIKSGNKKRVKNLQLLSIALIFLLPVLLAKLMLIQGSRGETMTQGGELISPITGYKQLNLANSSPEHWQLVYVTKNQCEQPCHNSLYNIQQVWRALGVEMPRVKLIIKGQTNVIYSSAELDWRLFQVEEKDKTMWSSYAGQVLIVDPLGNFVMKYLFDHNKQQSLVEAGHMLQDIKRLLKLSRIG